MRELAPVQTVELFPAERQELVSLLSQLSAEEWALPTVCAGWCVKDLALHVLGDDVGVLSRKRDGHSSQTQSVDSWDELVAFLNEWNEQWVAAARRLSPRLLIDLLSVTGDELYHLLQVDRLERARWAGELGGAGTGGGVAGHRQGVHGALAAPAADSRRGKAPGATRPLVFGAGAGDVRAGAAAYV